LSIFLYIIDSLKELILFCEMEDFLVFWENFYSSPEFWNLQPFDMSKLEGKISSTKLEMLDTELLCERLKNLKEGVKHIKVSDDVMDLLHQEYLSNHNNIVDILNNINNLIDRGETF